MSDRSINEPVLLKERNHLDAHRQELLQFEETLLNNPADPHHILCLVNRNTQGENALALMPHNQGRQSGLFS